MNKNPILVSLRVREGIHRVSNGFSDLNHAVSCSNDPVSIFKYFYDSPIFKSMEEAETHCLNIYSKGTSFSIRRNETWLDIVRWFIKESKSRKLKKTAMKLERLMT